MSDDLSPSADVAATITGKATGDAAGQQDQQAVAFMASVFGRTVADIAQTERFGEKPTTTLVFDDATELSFDTDSIQYTVAPKVVAPTQDSLAAVLDSFGTMTPHDAARAFLASGWLSEHDAALTANAKAEAWDEGYFRCSDDFERHHNHRASNVCDCLADPLVNNPHRTTRTNPGVEGETRTGVPTGHHWTCGGCGHEGNGSDNVEWYEHTKVCPRSARVLLVECDYDCTTHSGCRVHNPTKERQVKVKSEQDLTLRWSKVECGHDFVFDAVMKAEMADMRARLAVVGALAENGLQDFDLNPTRPIGGWNDFAWTDYLVRLNNSWRGTLHAALANNWPGGEPRR